MKDLIIYGCGDFGEELVWYISHINSISTEWNILGFVDDNAEPNQKIYGYPVLGDINYLLSYKTEINVFCSIANPDIKKKIIDLLSTNKNIKFPSLIHPSAIIADDAQLGKGVFIGPNAVVSIQTKIRDHVLIKQSTSIGHHSTIDAYSFIAPGCILGGHSKIGQSVDMGIGCSVILLAEVGENVTLGAGSVVVKNIPPNCTAVGVPAKPIKFREV